MTRIRPIKVNVTRYSHRPFTSTDPGQDLAESIKKDRSRELMALTEKLYSSLNAPMLGTITPFIVTESVYPGSVMARTPAYQGIVLQEDLPVGYEGKAVLKTDRKYFFIGERLG